MAVKNPYRPRVVKISVTLENPDGTTRTIDVDPSRCSAMFWDDASVLDILGGYYDRQKRAISLTDCQQAFGRERSRAIFGNQTTLTLNRNLIEKLWNTPDSSGELIGVMFKQHKCIPGG